MCPLKCLQTASIRTSSTQVQSPLTRKGQPKSPRPKTKKKTMRKKSLAIRTRHSIGWKSTTCRRNPVIREWTRPRTSPTQTDNKWLQTTLWSNLIARRNSRPIIHRFLRRTPTGLLTNPEAQSSTNPESSTRRLYWRRRQARLEK